MLFALAVVLPVMFWPAGVDTAPQLRNAGITHIAVPAANAAQWAKADGISVDPVELAGAVKLQSPGVALKIDEASASRIPWVSSNGWRFMRQPGAKFYYDVRDDTAALAAAEAFCYGAHAFIHPDAEGIQLLAKMLAFLKSVQSALANPIADIAFIDNGSTLSAEVMNLMVRENLLFNVLPADSGQTKLTVQLGSKDYPSGDVKDADSIVQKIRGNLTDANRSVRVFGASVVIVRLTGQPDKPRLHLLNYGAGHIRVGGFRVRVLGRYPKFQLHSFDSEDKELMDYEVQPDATEFTVPELKTYAVIDLAQ